MITSDKIHSLLYIKYLSKVTFEELITDLKEPYDDIILRNFIMTLDFLDIKERLIDEAKEYYARVYNCSKDEVLYGNWEINMDFIKSKKFPYACVIGDADVSYGDMSKLKYVAGSLISKGVRKFDNLVEVGRNAEFDSDSRFKRMTLHLPKLTKCKNLQISNILIDELNVTDDSILTIVNCEIKKILSAKSIKLLQISFAKISDMTSVEYIDTIKGTSDVKINYINPKFDINHLDILNECFQDNQHFFNEIVKAKLKTQSRNENLNTLNKNYSIE